MWPPLESKILEAFQGFLRATALTGYSDIKVNTLLAQAWINCGDNYIWPARWGLYNNMSKKYPLSDVCSAHGYLINWLSVSVCVMMEIIEWVGSMLVGIAGGNLIESLAVLPFIRLLHYHLTHSYGSQQEGKRQSRQIGEVGETMYHVIDSTCHNLRYRAQGFQIEFPSRCSP